MTKDQKAKELISVGVMVSQLPNMYLVDTGGMTVEAVNKLRGLCFKNEIKIRVIKNTLLRKAMEASGTDYSEIFPALKQQTAVFFVKENINAPAKVIKQMRGRDKKLPRLKGAYINGATFLGDDQLDALVSLKSKNEMIADIIATLQAPAKNVISALMSAGGKLAGILKTLEDKKSE